MSKFKDLELSDEKVGGGEQQSYDEAPEQRSFDLPLPEGTYVFELPPKGLIEDAVKTMDTKIGQRLYVAFNKECPLTVVLAKSNEEDLIGQVWRGLLTNRERNRARRGQPESLWSDWDYVLKALGEPAKPTSNLGYIQKLLDHAGERFVADNEFSAFCNSNRTKYIAVDDGPNVEDPDGGKGCGRNYYSRDIEKVDGQKVTSFLCKNPECGASLLVNLNLVNIRPYVVEE